MRLKTDFLGIKRQFREVKSFLPKKPLFFAIFSLRMRKIHHSRHLLFAFVTCKSLTREIILNVVGQIVVRRLLANVEVQIELAYVFEIVSPMATISTHHWKLNENYNMFQ